MRNLKEKFRKALSALALIGVIGSIIYISSLREDLAYEASLREAWVDGTMLKNIKAVPSTNLVDEVDSGSITLKSTELQNEQNENFDSETIKNIETVAVKNDKNCQDVQSKDTNYTVELSKVIIPETLKDGTLAKVKVELINTSNVAIYGDDNECENYFKFRIGAPFFQNEPHPLWNDLNIKDNNWIHNEKKSEIKINEKVVLPGETASADFWVRVPKSITSEVEVADEPLDTELTEVVELGTKGVSPIGEINGEMEGVSSESDAPKLQKTKITKWAYERFTFAPVIEGKWLETNIPLVLTYGEIPERELEKLAIIEPVLNDFSLVNFRGEKNVYIDLKEQKSYLRYGDTPFYSYVISSGAWDTPTPIGDHTVFNKQELRIGGKAPHYKMPYWIGLKTNGSFRGYGFHEVPYLGVDKNKSDFYQKGLKYDLGKNVSHGCVRAGPNDALFVYNFAEEGMKISVRKNNEELIARQTLSPVF